MRVPPKLAILLGITVALSSLPLLQGFFSQAEGTAFAFLTAVRENQPNKVRTLLLPSRWSLAFQEDPRGFLAPNTEAEPNLAFLAGQDFTMESVSSSPPQPLNVAQVCTPRLLCPEQAVLQYRLSFPDNRKAPSLLPIDLIVGGRQRKQLQQNEVEAFSHRPTPQGLLLITRRLSPSGAPTALPQSTRHYQPDLSGADFITASHADKSLAGEVLAPDGHLLQPEELRELLPRTTTLRVQLAVQRPDVFSTWKVAQLGIVEVTVRTPEGKLINLRDFDLRHH